MLQQMNLTFQFISKLRTVLASVMTTGDDVPFLVDSPPGVEISKLCETVNEAFTDSSNPLSFRVFPVSVNNQQDVCICSLEQWEYMIAHKSGGDNDTLSALYESRIGDLE